LRDPFLFHPHTRLSQLSPTQKITLLLQHTRLFVDTWGERKRFDIMKKFFKLYISGFEGDIQLRTTLMQQDNCEGTIKILERHLGSYGFEA
jgi:tRNA-dihydrouridine synthase